MPRSFTWKQLLWTGIVLTVVGLAASQYLFWVVFLLGGQEAINNVALQWVQTVVGQVALQLGIALIGMLLVVRAIGKMGVSGTFVTEDVQHHSASATGPASASRPLVRTFWVGVVLVVFGLTLQGSMAAWQWSLSGATDVGRGLARDLLSIVGAPFEAVSLPLGTLLIAGSFVARTVAVNTGRRVPSAERF